jgi:hypothetical protein
LVSVSKIKAYVEGKKEFDVIFPVFIEKVGARVEEALLPDFPLMKAWVGPKGTRRVLELNPDMKEPLYLDWVCFGFEGYDPNETHIGVLFDLDNWPFTFRIGVHGLDHVWAKHDEQIKAVLQRMGDTACKEYTFQKHYKEHQWNDAPKELNLEMLEKELDSMAERVVTLYRNFNPIIKKA